LRGLDEHSLRVKGVYRIVSYILCMLYAIFCYLWSCIQVSNSAYRGDGEEGLHIARHVW